VAVTVQSKATNSGKNVLIFFILCRFAIRFFRLPDFMAQSNGEINCRVEAFDDSATSFGRTER